jgi:ADP-heptose:LPS heptosyltransferase
VLVWNVDSIGDFLWTTPTLLALRRGYANAEITLVCNSACRAVAETNPNVDRVISIDPVPYYSGGGLLRCPAELAQQTFDVMLVLEMGSRPADAGRLLGRRLNVGYLVSTNLGILKSLPDHTLAPNRDTYWPEYFLAAVKHLGLAAPAPQLQVTTTAADEAEAESLLSPPPAETLTIGLHPYVAPYALATKKWPDDSFVRLAQILRTRRRVRFVLTGSPAEAEACAALAARIRTASGAEVICAAERLGLRAVVSLMRRLDLVVVGDTAALHLATAAGTPTVALFGATDSRRIAPSTASCVVLQRGLPCSPCHRYDDRRPAWPRCRFDHPRCLHEITPEDVADAVDRILLRSRRCSPENGSFTRGSDRGGMRWSP